MSQIFFQSKLVSTMISWENCKENVTIMFITFYVKKTSRPQLKSYARSCYLSWTQIIHVCTFPAAKVHKVHGNIFRLHDCILKRAYITAAYGAWCHNYRKICHKFCYDKKNEKSRFGNWVWIVAGFRNLPIPIVSVQTLFKFMDFMTDFFV